MNATSQINKISHYPADITFIESTLARLPLSLQRSVGNTYSYQFNTSGRQAANLYLLSVQGYLDGKTLLTLSDENIRLKAERLAGNCKVTDMNKAADYLQSQGFSLPAGDSAESIIARVKCPVWWERSLRKKQDREQEQLHIQLGMIRRGYQPYCSSALLMRIQARQKRAMKMLEGFEAVSDEGDVLNLLDVLKGSVANPAVRRAELMVRMRGFEDYANTQNHVAMFYTITTPSKYHRVSGAGLNDKYQDFTPRDAQRYLCQVWARIRAKLKRDGMNVYGFRVAEPHHDGTPHWHLLLFMEPAHCKAVSAIIRHYALQEDSDEAGAAKHRFEAVAIDSSKGSATGYIAKYVSKNIDGFGMDTDDETGSDAKDSAQRVRAWASAWGIRQFQQVGGAPVGVWRELRRVESAPDGLLEQARQAADAGDWALYLTLQGGAEANRSDQPLRVFTVEHINTETGEVCQNRYGEFINRVQGVTLNEVLAIETRLKVWTIQQKPVQAESMADVKPHTDYDVLADVLRTFTLPATEPDFLPDSGFSAFPWSAFNNCTRQQQHGLEAMA
ncbi:MAG: replication endonuclease [Thiolinea sp.]